MFRRVLLSLSLLGASAAGAVAVTGCGASKVASIDVAKAADSTASKQTAHVTMTMHASGAGLPAPLTITGDGVTDLTKPRGNFSFDLAQVASSVGVPSSFLGSDSKLTMRFTGRDIYAKVPAIPLITSRLNGKHWIGADLPQLGEALGIDAKALGKLSNVDPASQLKTITSVKGIKKVGDEQIAGDDTTHYKGSYSLADVVDALPADRKAQAQAGLDQLKKLPGGQDAVNRKQDAELWVGKDDVLRQMKINSTIPGVGGTGGGAFDMTYRLGDFGTPLDVSAPPAADTFQVKPAMLQRLKSTAGIP